MYKSGREISIIADKYVPREMAHRKAILLLHDSRECPSIVLPVLEFGFSEIINSTARVRRLKAKMNQTDQSFNQAA